MYVLEGRASHCNVEPAHFCNHSDHDEDGTSAGRVLLENWGPFLFQSIGLFSEHMRAPTQ